MSALAAPEEGAQLEQTTQLTRENLQIWALILITYKLNQIRIYV
jgi:hypothetical protein